MSTPTHAHEHSTYAHVPPAVHGMVMFGDKSIYLSHMPMFQAPHNAQVILEVSLTKDGEQPEDQYREDRRSTGNTLYSVEPQKMRLSDLQQDASFTGKVFRGNFETDGELLSPDVTITIKSVVHFRTLDPATKPDPSAGRRYLFFGQPGQFFAVHEITAAPSFDHILPIIIDAPDVAQSAFPTATPLRIPGKDNKSSRLTSGETADADFPEAIGPDGQKGVRSKIIAGDEIFFDDQFLK
jgi:hypothetical protein